MRRCFADLLAAIAAMLLVARTGSAGPMYQVTDLGVLSGVSSSGLGINNSGEVTGNIVYAENRTRAFLYSGGVTQDLGTFGAYASDGEAINDSGQVAVIVSYIGSGRHSLIYDHGVVTDIGTIPNRPTDTVAFGINASGHVTGMAPSNNPGVPQAAFLYSGGTMTDLNSLVNPSSGWQMQIGLGINTHDQVAGVAYNVNTGATHAFLYGSGAMTDLGTLGGTFSYGQAINNSGQVVGYADTKNGAQHAFLYSNGTMGDLGTIEFGNQSEATGINSSGQVVGFSDGSAFLYYGRQLTNLNSLIDPSSDWALIYAWAINDGGQITGDGEIGGQQHAFLLTPVPEPSSVVLLGLSAVGLLAVARRARTRPRA